MSEQDLNRPPLPLTGGATSLDAELQFQTAEPIGAGGSATGTACAACKSPIVDAYYAVSGHAICAACRNGLLAQTTGGSRTFRLFKATAFGLGAALLGAAIWYGVRRISGYEIGLIAILVGFMVGAAVRRGSNARGGRGYQILAVVLTYFGIAANYVPDIFQMLLKDLRQRDVATSTVDGSAAGSTTQTSTTAPATATAAVTTNAAGRTQPAAAKGARPTGIKLVLAFGLLLVLVFALAMAAPFLQGAQNIIGILIIGFALWEAWKINSRRVPAVTGPFPLSQAPPLLPPGTGT